MSVEEHLQEFHGLPVADFPSPREERPLSGAAEVAWRLAVDEDPAHRFKWPTVLLETFEQKWRRFLTTVDASQVRAVVVGPWSGEFRRDAGEVVRLLADSAAELPGLRAVFLGDLVREEREISYIGPCDATPLAAAYPLLEELGVRGRPSFGPVEHQALRTLRFESGGLSREAVTGLLTSDLPALESLNLWLGVDEYGGDVTVPDLAPLLSGQLFPKLRHLGLEDSELQDEIAAAVASAPMVARLESLSLAMGTLTDDGAAALLDGQPLTHLKSLDLHHHFLTDPMVERVRAALPGVAVRLDCQLEAEEDDGEIWRYVAVSE
ncbi:STM4015 family protein [Kitasatospora sp. NPDC002227]|uniref:STM4015 family protein n=1 Tax=Kitasatospora sp. NPDC002227 TaxID=3154773 RepID=UPI003324956D